jgi:hypothetical protein
MTFAHTLLFIVVIGAMSIPLIVTITALISWLRGRWR